MAIWLKEGKSESEIIEADEKVKRTVEGILNDVSKRGDEAVRELSLKFDNYSPESFILKNDIENIVDKVNKKDLEDIKFAQDQVRNFALKQLECLTDLEVETIRALSCHKIFQLILLDVMFLVENIRWLLLHICR